MGGGQAKPISHRRPGGKLLRYLFIFLIVSVVPISGCMSIATRALLAVLSDPRTKKHAFYAQIDIYFRIKGIDVQAVRYSDVYYLNGGSQADYRFPFCDQTKTSCWAHTSDYFLAMPNGDIARIFVDITDTPLAGLPVRTPVHARARLAGIYRDQPEAYYAKGNEHGSCLPLELRPLNEEYGIPIAVQKSTDGRMSQEYPDLNRIMVNVQVTRSDTDRNPGVLGPDDFYLGAGVDRKSCKYLISHMNLNRGVVFRQ